MRLLYSENMGIKIARNKAEEVLGENYQTEPPINIQDIVSNYGLSVREAHIENNNVAGLIDTEAKAIYVNADDHPKRQAFTVAHELGHYLLHKDKLKQNPDEYAILYRQPLGGHQDEIEMEANTFAANLLVPRSMLEKYLDYDKATIARIFGVSTDVIGYRLSDEFPERKAVQ